MFDFRYHALSLAAVFLALVVGLLLGIEIGDRGLVSSAEKKLRQSLRADVDAARDESQRLRDRLALRSEFEDQVYPELVTGQLQDRRIGVVFLGGSSSRASRDRLQNYVRDGLVGTGGRVVFVGVLREPLDLAGLAQRAEGTRYAAVDLGSDLIQPLGRRVGEQLTQGGKLIRRMRGKLFSSFSGSLTKLDGVVVVRDPPKLESDAARAAKLFEDGLADGLTRRDTPAVGVETISTKPSQVAWYRDRELASVDDVDDIAGRLALVFTLAGADGAYGVKSTRDSLIPRVVGGVRAP
jgi:Copper transport outer membrane protein, MctB